jgi:type I restriction enzyme M protein
MLDNVTKRKIDSARNILVGKVPDPKAQVEQITTALVYKFMDDMDKESKELGGEARFFTNGFSQYSWTKLMDNRLSGQERLELYAEAIANMSKNPHIPQLFRDIFKGAFLPFRDPRTLNLFLKEINEFNYDHSENLGNAFEYLLSILGSQGDAGQFRTPRHIIDFIVEVVNPQKNETILDPACGTAGFLISAYKHIIKTNSSNFKPEEEKAEDKIVQGETATETIIADKINYSGDLLSPDDKTKLTQNIAGYDISPDMVKLALVNLYLHGFSDPKIFEYDTLSSEKRWDEHFDIILANPPFMTPKGGIVPHKRFSIQANRAEVLFVDYIAEHLSIKGRAGIIVPEGIIFQSANAYKNLRKNLIENWGLYAVVSLPSGVFQPYSGVKTSILLMDKEFAKRSKEILFLKVENDGFDLGAQRRKIDKNDLPDCLEVLEMWKKDQTVDESSKIAFAVKKEKIAENGDYNLTGDRYRETVDYSNPKWPMVELGEVCEFIGGYAFKSEELKKERLNNYFPVVKIGNVDKSGVLNISNAQYSEYSESLRKFLIERDDILIAMTGATVGKVAYSQYEKLLLNQRVGLVRANQKQIIKSFLKNLLLSKQFYNYCQVQAGGGAQGNISPNQIKSYQIPLPPLEVQEQIVAEIEQYQKVINGAKQVVANWKPNFSIDPSWEMVELGKVVEIQRGGSPRPIQDYITKEADGMNWIKIGDVAEGEKYITKTKQKIRKEGLSKTRLVKDGDFILSNSMSFGRPYIVKIDGAIHDGWLLIRINDENQIDPNFLYQILGTEIVKKQYERLATGGVVKNLNSSLVKSVKIPLPPLDVQEQIVAEIEAEQKVVNANKELMEKMEKKIEAKIGEVWGDEI